MKTLIATDEAKRIETESSEETEIAIIDEEEAEPLKVKCVKSNPTNKRRNSSNRTPWIIMGGKDRPNLSDSPRKDIENEILLTDDQQYENFILHLRDVANYKTEFDIYQILAYRAKIPYDQQKRYIKPFKVLKRLINERWSDMQIRWLSSFQRVLCQAVVCWCIQILGVTVILGSQLAAYFDDEIEHAKCDYHLSRWQTDWHLKLLAFLFTSFISLGVSGWLYRARHSGFYPILLNLERDQYPDFVDVNILQIGLLTNFFVVASAVIGSFILIYQTEGGTKTINMVLQAVALFFVLELDNRMVHSRDFLSIRRYLDDYYIKYNKHKRLPQSKTLKGNVCLADILSIFSFMLLIITAIGALFAPWLIMICW